MEERLTTVRIFDFYVGLNRVRYNVGGHKKIKMVVLPPRSTLHPQPLPPSGSSAGATKPPPSSSKPQTPPTLATHTCTTSWASTCARWEGLPRALWQPRRTVGRLHVTPAMPWRRSGCKLRESAARQVIDWSARFSNLCLFGYCSCCFHVRCTVRSRDL